MIVGIPNASTSCFVNSAVQLLSRDPNFQTVHTGEEDVDRMMGMVADLRKGVQPTPLTREETMRISADAEGLSDPRIVIDRLYKYNTTKYNIPFIDTSHPDIDFPDRPFILYVEGMDGFPLENDTHRLRGMIAYTNTHFIYIDAQDSVFRVISDELVTEHPMPSGEVRLQDFQDIGVSYITVLLYTRRPPLKQSTLQFDMDYNTLLDMATPESSLYRILKEDLFQRLTTGSRVQVFAPTGSGKTRVGLLPAVLSYSMNIRDPETKHITIIAVPYRVIANQFFDKLLQIKTRFRPLLPKLLSGDNVLYNSINLFARQKHLVERLGVSREDFKKMFSAEYLEKGELPLKLYADAVVGTYEMIDELLRDKQLVQSVHEGKVVLDVVIDESQEIFKVGGGRFSAASSLFNNSLKLSHSLLLLSGSYDLRNVMINDTNLFDILEIEVLDYPESNKIIHRLNTNTSQYVIQTLLKDPLALETIFAPSFLQDIIHRAPLLYAHARFLLGGIGASICLLNNKRDGVTTAIAIVLTALLISYHSGQPLQLYAADALDRGALKTNESGDPLTDTVLKSFADLPRALQRTKLAVYKHREVLNSEVLFWNIIQYQRKRAGVNTKRMVLKQPATIDLFDLINQRRFQRVIQSREDFLRIAAECTLVFANASSDYQADLEAELPTMTEQPRLWMATQKIGVGADFKDVRMVSVLRTQQGMSAELENQVLGRVDREKRGGLIFSEERGKMEVYLSVANGRSVLEYLLLTAEDNESIFKKGEDRLRNLLIDMLNTKISFNVKFFRRESRDTSVWAIKGYDFKTKTFTYNNTDIGYNGFYNLLALRTITYDPARERNDVLEEFRELLVLYRRKQRYLNTANTMEVVLGYLKSESPLQRIDTPWAKRQTVYDLYVRVLKRFDMEASVKPSELVDVNVEEEYAKLPEDVIEKLGNPSLLVVRYKDGYNVDMNELILDVVKKLPFSTLFFMTTVLILLNDRSYLTQDVEYHSGTVIDEFARSLRHDGADYSKPLNTPLMDAQSLLPDVLHADPFLLYALTYLIRHPHLQYTESKELRTAVLSVVPPAVQSEVFALAYQLTSFVFSQTYSYLIRVSTARDASNRLTSKAARLIHYLYKAGRGVVPEWAIDYAQWDVVFISRFAARWRGLMQDEAFGQFTAREARDSALQKLYKAPSASGVRNMPLIYIDTGAPEVTYLDSDDDFVDTEI